MTTPKAEVSPVEVQDPGKSRKDGVGKKGAGRKSGPLSQKRKQLVVFGSWWWTLPALTAVFLVHYVATGYGMGYAFTDYTGLGEANWIGIENFIQLTGDPEVLGTIGNTFFLAIAYFIIVNLIGLLLALALNRTLKSRYILRTVLFLPVVLSSLAVSYIFKFIFEPTGALNKVLSVFGFPSDTAWLADPATAIYCILLVMIWQHIGIPMVIFLAGLATVPQELEEAAAIDGATTFGRFWHISLPILQPAIAISTTLALVSGLRVFDQVVAMTGGGPYGATDTLSTVIYRYTFEYSNYGYGSAIATVFTVVLAATAGLQLFITRDRAGKK